MRLTSRSDRHLLLSIITIVASSSFHFHLHFCIARLVPALLSLFNSNGLSFTMRGQRPVKRGLSKRAIVKTGSGTHGIASSTRLNPRDAKSRLEEGAAKRKEEVRAMDASDREATRLMIADRSRRSDAIFEGSEEDSCNTIPMGDEGMYSSHAGGEESLLPDLRESWFGSKLYVCFRDYFFNFHSCSSHSFTRPPRAFFPLGLPSSSYRVKRFHAFTNSMFEVW